VKRRPDMAPLNSNVTPDQAATFEQAVKGLP
jgi:hypothetical protein